MFGAIGVIRDQMGRDSENRTSAVAESGGKENQTYRSTQHGYHRCRVKIIEMFVSDCRPWPTPFRLAIMINQRRIPRANRTCAPPSTCPASAIAESASASSSPPLICKRGGARTHTYALTIEQNEDKTHARRRSWMRHMCETGWTRSDQHSIPTNAKDDKRTDKPMLTSCINSADVCSSAYMFRNSAATIAVATPAK
jgi:hypothetical protein